MTWVIECKAADIMIPRTGTQTRVSAVIACNLEGGNFGSRHALTRLRTVPYHYTFVRHPVPLLKSWFRFSQFAPITGAPLDKSSFPNFVDDYLRTSAGSISKMYELASENADRTERCEDWPNNIIRCWTEAGITFDENPLRELPWEHVSLPNYPFFTEYGPGQLSRVLDAEDKAIKRWYLGTAIQKEYEDETVSSLS